MISETLRRNGFKVIKVAQGLYYANKDSKVWAVYEDANGFIVRTGDYSKQPREEHYKRNKKGTRDYIVRRLMQ